MSPGDWKLRRISRLIASSCRRRWIAVIVGPLLLDLAAWSCLDYAERAMDAHLVRGEVCVERRLDVRPPRLPIVMEDEQAAGIDSRLRESDIVLDAYLRMATVDENDVGTRKRRHRERVGLDESQRVPFRDERLDIRDDLLHPDRGLRRIGRHIRQVEAVDADEVRVLERSHEQDEGRSAPQPHVKNRRRVRQTTGDLEQQLTLRFDEPPSRNDR